MRTQQALAKKSDRPIAVYAEGDNLTFKNCRLLGHQDTLFTGPLPLKESSREVSLVLQNLLREFLTNSYMKTVIYAARLTLYSEVQQHTLKTAHYMHLTVAKILTVIILLLQHMKVRNSVTCLMAVHLQETALRKRAT